MHFLTTTKKSSITRLHFDFVFGINSAPTIAATSGTTPLTLESITKHDARLSYAGGDVRMASNGAAPTVNDIAMSLKSFNFSDDEAGGESEFGTFKTFKTFASSYSACSNMTFNK